MVVGDLVRIRRNEAIPADILLLHSSDELGACYVETSSLDGEVRVPRVPANDRTCPVCPPRAGRTRPRTGRARLWLPRTGRTRLWLPLVLESDPTRRPLLTTQSNLKERQALKHTQQLLRTGEDAAAYEGRAMRTRALPPSWGAP